MITALFCLALLISFCYLAWSINEYKEAYAYKKFYEVYIQRGDSNFDSAKYAQYSVEAKVSLIIIAISAIFFVSSFAGLIFILAR